MKAIMYHYVRPNAPGLPHFPYLDVDHFTRQLDWFAAKHDLVSRDKFCAWLDGGEAPDGALLTFDDGLRDHVEFVLPILRARGLWGLFYVSSRPVVEGTLLDVHKVHLALGRVGGIMALTWLEIHAPNILMLSKARQPSSLYAAQDSDSATKFVKELFNWQLSAEERYSALNGLLDYAFTGRPPQWQDVYLDEQGLRTLIDAGMGVGPHSHRHEIASRLPLTQQKYEIVRSRDFVESVGGSRMWGYCYPYGAAEAFTPQTEAAVAEAGCPLAFAVNAADIDVPLAGSRRYALPRYNCNIFPHGTKSVGGLRWNPTAQPSA